MIYRRRRANGGSPTKTNPGESGQAQTKTEPEENDRETDTVLRDQTATGRPEVLAQEEEAQEHSPQTFAETEREPKTAAGQTAGDSSQTPQSGEAQKSRRHSRSGVEPSAEKEKISGKNTKT